MEFLKSAIQSYSIGGLEYPRPIEIQPGVGSGILALFQILHAEATGIQRSFFLFGFAHSYEWNANLHSGIPTRISAAFGPSQPLVFRCEWGWGDDRRRRRNFFRVLVPHTQCVSTPPAFGWSFQPTPGHFEPTKAEKQPLWDIFRDGQVALRDLGYILPLVEYPAGPIAILPFPGSGIVPNSKIAQFWGMGCPV